MIKLISSPLLIIILTNYATIQDIVSKRKVCTGENQTLSDLTSKNKNI